MVGLDAYPGTPLTNATSDARSLADLLAEDYGFRIVGGAAQVDSDIGPHGLKELLTSSLRSIPADCRWLFFFAGHGTLDAEGHGHLVLPGPPGACPSLSLAWLTELCLDSPAAEALLVLDTCHAGAALRGPGRGALLPAPRSKRRGAVYLLAAGGPGQRVMDGGGEEHSVFTQCLLEALDGQLGLHNEEGIVSFSRLAAHLPDQVHARLSQHRQDVLAVPMQIAQNGSESEFRFVPRHARLPPDLVQDLIQRTDLQRRCQALERLPTHCLQQPPSLTTEGRLLWHLPLALDLLTLVIEEGAPGPEPTWSLGRGWESEGETVRHAAARAVGQLLGPISSQDAANLEHRALGAKVDRALDGLSSLALDDPDPRVRWVALRSLGRASAARRRQQLVDRALAQPTTSWSCRWRRLAFEAALPTADRPGWRQVLPLLHELHRLLNVPLWVLGHRWSRRLVGASLLSLLSLSLAMVSTYHFQVDENQRLVVLRGLDGLEILPRVGDLVLETDWRLQDLWPREELGDTRLIERRLVTDIRRTRGVWRRLDLESRWAQQSHRWLAVRPAVLVDYRLRRPEEVRRRLNKVAKAGRPEAVQVAAYLATLDDAWFPFLWELAVESLEHGESPEILEILGAVAGWQPERVSPVAQAWSRRLLRLDGAAALAYAEAISAIAPHASPAAYRALKCVLDRGWAVSETDSMPTHQRWQATVQRLLAALPSLSQRDRERLFELIQRSGTTHQAIFEAAFRDPLTPRSLARALLLTDNPQALILGLSMLRHHLERGGYATAEVQDLLASLSHHEDPEVVIAGARAAARCDPRIATETYVSRLAYLADELDREALIQDAITALGELQGMTVRSQKENANDFWAARALSQLTYHRFDVQRGAAWQEITRLILLRRFVSDHLQELLARGLRDPSPWVRQEAALAAVAAIPWLGEPPPRVDQLFLDQLQRPGDGSRVAQQLAGAHANSVAWLLHLLTREADGRSDPQAHQVLLQDLLRGPLEPEHLIRGLAPAFRHPPGPALQPHQLRSLVEDPQFIPAAARQPLIGVLLQTSVSSPLAQRRMTTGLLSQLMPERQTTTTGQVLCRLLADEDRAAASWAAESLVRVRGPGSKEALECLVHGSLTDPRPELRLTLFEALKRLPVASLETSPSLLQQLHAALSADDLKLRHLAASLEARLRAEIPSLPPVAARWQLETERVTRAWLGLTWFHRSRDPWVAERVLMQQIADLEALSSSPTADPQEISLLWQRMEELVAEYPPLLPRGIEAASQLASTLLSPLLTTQTLRRWGLRASDNDLADIVDVLLENWAVAGPSEGTFILYNGLEPLARLRPESSHAIQHGLEKTLDRETLRQLGRGERRALAQTFDVALASQLADDPQRLIQHIGSPLAAQRQTALRAMVLALDQHPERLGAFREQLSKELHSTSPTVRLSVARGLELLHLGCQATRATEDADAFWKLTHALDGPGDGLTHALQRALRDVAPGQLTPCLPPL